MEKDEVSESRKKLSGAKVVGMRGREKITLEINELKESGLELKSLSVRCCRLSRPLRPHEHLVYLLPCLFVNMCVFV